MRHYRFRRASGFVEEVAEKPKPAQKSFRLDDVDASVSLVTPARDCLLDIKQVGRYGPLWYSMHLPIQIWPLDSGGFNVIHWTPGVQMAATNDAVIIESQMPQFCRNSAIVLRNLAKQFDKMADGLQDKVYNHVELRMPD